MKKHHASFLFYALLITTALPLRLTGQTCSNAALTAKYWGYKKTFNEHFIKIDRKPDGCIGNGLTAAGSEPATISCNTELLHGLSLPATSINMAPYGYDALGERGWKVGAPVGTPTPFTDFDCAGVDNSVTPPETNISWDKSTHNYIEFSVETPHQLGWYLVVLATEYELLNRNGKYDQAQKTLEELFLALQAYRRLDITANCLVKKRYDEITSHLEADICAIQEGPLGYCLCPEKYNIGPCSDNEEHFDIPCRRYCGWEPDLSGYSGFFIREDATQELCALNDPSEGQWNIDLVGSSFAMSQSPPCNPGFSQTCYMVHEGRFLSSDQMFAVMMGLAMVKRFIPPAAIVTTCDGAVYHPLDMAQKIAKGFVDLPDNATRHIFWPGSDRADCCLKPVKFGECNGGNFQWLYAGIKHLYNYIDPAHKQDICPLDRMKWASTIGSSSGNSNANYVLESMAFAEDWDNMSNIRRTHLRSGARNREKEIFTLINDVVYPIGANNVTAEEKELFKQMLCDAPCGGPCIKPFDYDNHDNTWPAFDCANTPGWTGQRWEGPPHSSIDWDPTKTYQARQFNGLDYMALHNLYLLRFPEEEMPFADPELFHEGDTHLLGEAQITGPSFLCPYGSGTYTLAHSYPNSILQSIQWKPSDHFDVSTITGNPTQATFARPGAIGYPIINVDVEEVRSITQWNAVEAFDAPDMPATWVLAPETQPFTDVCPLSYSKHIAYGNTPFSITTELDHCAQDYWFHASGPPANSFSWEVTAVSNNPALPPVTHIGSGQHFNLTHPHPSFPGTAGVLYISLSVATNCGNFDSEISVPYECKPQGFSIRVDPNPASTQVAVTVVRNDLGTYIINDPNGMQVNIIPSIGTANGISSTIYTNGQSIPISTLPNGLYNVTAIPPGTSSTLNTTLVILR